MAATPTRPLPAHLCYNYPLAGAAEQVAQIPSGAGCVELGAVARYWRQVKIGEIGEGAGETNRQIIRIVLSAER